MIRWKLSVNQAMLDLVSYPFGDLLQRRRAVSSLKRSRVSQKPFVDFHKDEKIMDLPLIIKQVCQQPGLMEVMQRGSGAESRP